MSTAYTPEWWLKKLSDELVARQPRIAELRSYANGDAPLPEGAEGMREAYRAFQRKARTNFGALIVEAVRERMTPAGFRVGDSEQMDSEANRIWQANQLDVFSGDVHQDMLTVGYGYVLVNGPDQQRTGFWGVIDRLFGTSGVPVITREDPALMVTAHDPLQPQRVVAALKMFRDGIEDKDYAYLYLPGKCYVAEKSATSGTVSPDLTSSAYVIVDTRSMPRGFEDVVPVICFENNDALGEFEPHTDVIDRINYMTLQRLVITAIQAFRQRALKEGEAELPEYELDADGNPVLDDDGLPVKVDYSSVFRPGPGALWKLPHGMELWESTPTDFSPILAATKDDVRALAAVTRTPMSTLMPEGENQSAEGATFAREGLIFKTKDRMKRASYGWNSAMSLALRLAGEPVEEISVEWEQVELRTLAEKADAASKAADWPFKTKLRKIWGLTPQEAERVEQERIQDVMLGMLNEAENDGV